MKSNDMTDEDILNEVNEAAPPAEEVSHEEAARRVTVCRGCELFDGMYCSACSCSVFQLALNPTGSCAERKW